MVNFHDFQSDSQGRTFTDVTGDTRISFQAVIDFFNDPVRILRMIDSEEHHERPPLAGVVKEFERNQEIDSFFSNNDSHTTKRFRQAVGVLVRIHMEKEGWGKTGTKGSLGTRVRTKTGTTTPGAYHNVSGLSKWFTKSERYKIKK